MDSALDKIFVLMVKFIKCQNVEFMKEKCLHSWKKHAVIMVSETYFQ